MRPLRYSINVTLDDLNAELVRDDLRQVVERLKAEPGEGLWVGGVTLPPALADLGLIAEVSRIAMTRAVRARQAPSPDPPS